MGYTPTLKRRYSVLSILAVGFSLTNSWFGISAALITGINSGGPLLIVYGVIGVCVISIAVGVSLGELVSLAFSSIMLVGQFGIDGRGVGGCEG